MIRQHVITNDPTIIWTHHSTSAGMFNHLENDTFFSKSGPCTEYFGPFHLLGTEGGGRFVFTRSSLYRDFFTESQTVIGLLTFLLVLSVCSSFCSVFTWLMAGTFLVAFREGHSLETGKCQSQPEARAGCHYFRSKPGKWFQELGRVPDVFFFLFFVLAWRQRCP